MRLATPLFLCALFALSSGPRDASAAGGAREAVAAAAPQPAVDRALPAGEPPSAMAIRSGGEARKLLTEVGGGRPAVLHFWATWCDACRAEFPKLHDLLLSLPARHIAVALVSLDQPRDLDAARTQLSTFGLSELPAVLLDAPRPEPVASALGVPRWDGALPATLLFDSRGRLQRAFIGAADPQKLSRAIDSLKKRRAARKR